MIHWSYYIMIHLPFTTQTHCRHKNCQWNAFGLGPPMVTRNGHCALVAPLALNATPALHKCCKCSPSPYKCSECWHVSSIAMLQARMTTTTAVPRRGSTETRRTTAPTTTNLSSENCETWSLCNLSYTKCWETPRSCETEDSRVESYIYQYPVSQWWICSCAGVSISISAIDGLSCPRGLQLQYYELLQWFTSNIKRHSSRK